MAGRISLRGTARLFLAEWNLETVYSLLLVSGKNFFCLCFELLRLQKQCF